MPMRRIHDVFINLKPNQPVRILVIGKIHYTKFIDFYTIRFSIVISRSVIFSNDCNDQLSKVCNYLFI